MEFDFSGDSIKKDWSLTSWSEHGAIEITNKDGSASDSHPYIAS